MNTIHYKYGDFTDLQIKEVKKKMRKQIFFLLILVDPNTSGQFRNVDAGSAIEDVLRTYGSLNNLLGYPKEFVDVMVLLNAAYLEYQKGSEEFEWSVYRKNILDAGSAVLSIKED